MAAERREGDAVREFRFEGLGVLGIAVAFVIVLSAAFFLGRWYERQVQPAHLAAGGADNPLAHVVQAEEPINIDDAAGVFDEVAGGEQELEPGREATVARKTPPPEPASPQPAAKVAGGSFYVQVFAGRDRPAAEGLVNRLKGEGYTVRLFSEREGRGALYKVRVGGYADRAAADSAVTKLQKQGYSGSWVTRIE